MASQPTLNDLLKSHIPSESRSALRDSVIPGLLDAVQNIATTLRSSQNVSLAGGANAFGDEQLNVDVSSEKCVRDAIAKCSSIKTASSEEDPVERSSDEAEDEDDSANSEIYTIAFDPLDGSSIIAPNWSVGTIIGIWDGRSAINQAPHEKQVAAILGVYGPRTTAIIAVRTPGGKPVCIEIGLSDDGGTERHQVIRSNVVFATAPFKTRYFAPANLRAGAEDEKYMNLITKFIREKYTLRYSGGLVPDLVHALVKGHGIYISPTTAASKAKLRRLYELYPVALIMECAGGLAIDPADGQRILEKTLADCDERGGLICGIVEEVEHVKAALLG